MVASRRRSEEGRRALVGPRPWPLGVDPRAGSQEIAPTRRRVVKRLLLSCIVIPASVLLYAFVLREMYTALVLPNFGYIGYRLVPTEIYVDIISCLATVVVAVLLPVRPNSVSDVIVWVLFVVVISPTMLMLPYLGPARPWESLGFSCSLGAALLVTVFVARRRAAPRALSFRTSKATFWIIIVVFSIMVYVYMAVTVGVNLSYLSVLDVYDTRSDYREALAEATLLGYLVSTQANVVNPLIIAMGIRRKNWLMILVPIVGQLVLYSGTGFKTVLFSIIAIIVFVVLFRASRKPLLISLLWGASGLLAVSWLLDIMSNSFIWTSIFGRRFLYTPARLSGLYFEWYSNNPFSLMGNSILKPWVESSYAYGPARTIAIYATGEAEASLNANVFAAGFAEFGWFGIFGVAILLGFYLRFLNRAAAGLPILFSAIVVVMPAVTLSNTAFHTALLSHGLVAAVVLLAIVPRDGANAEDEIVGTRFRLRPNAIHSRKL